MKKAGLWKTEVWEDIEYGLYSADYIGSTDDPIGDWITHDYVRSTAVMTNKILSGARGQQNNIAAIHIASHMNYDLLVQ